MTAATGRYIAVETGIAIVANIVMADVAAAILFHRQDPIPVGGLVGLAGDMVIQTFAVAFMTVLIATILTRRRRRSGKLHGLSGAVPRGPRPALLRALLVALGCAVVAAPVSFLSLAAGPPSWTVPAMFALKSVYAALLAALIAPPTLRAALRDPVATVS